MLLYWSMLDYGCQQGYRQFDFGRSTPGEGTYKFKQQWGAIESPLNWITYVKQQSVGDTDPNDQRNKFNVAMQLWTKIPVAITRLIGPPLRKNIGL
jgi:hypothetical protein